MRKETGTKRRPATEHVRDVLQQRLGDGGASVSALAEALGVTRSTVYHWRAGTRGLGADEIMALARELEMTLSGSRKRSAPFPTLW